MEHSISIIHACAQYAANMPYFRDQDIMGILCNFMLADVQTNMRRRAVKAVIYIRRHDPRPLEPFLEQHRVSALTQKELSFYRDLYHASKADKIQGAVGDLLIDLGVAETMGRRLQQLVQEDELLTEYPTTVPLIHCLWNYTDTNRRFSVVLRNMGLFQTCQEIIRNPDYKDHLDNEVSCEFCNRRSRSAGSIVHRYFLHLCAFVFRESITL